MKNINVFKIVKLTIKNIFHIIILYLRNFTFSLEIILLKFNYFNRKYLIPRDQLS